MKVLRRSTWLVWTEKGGEERIWGKMSTEVRPECEEKIKPSGGSGLFTMFFLALATTTQRSVKLDTQILGNSME